MSSFYNNKPVDNFALHHLDQKKSTSESMPESEAIRLLMHCYELAKKLDSINLKLELNLNECKALAGFERVRRAGFAYGRLIRLANSAGLTSGDLGMLNWYCNLLTETRQSGLSA